MIAKHRYFKWILNFWPCIWMTGARITHLSPDFTELTVELPLTWRTRNRVGTIFGGSLYAASDPFYMLMLMEILGRDFVVWDKGASFKFKRPGKSTLYYRFKIEPSQIEWLRAEVAKNKEVTFEWPVNAVDQAGVVHTEIIKTMYVAEKAFYKEKLARRTAK
jgi:hypothetical protein